MRKGFTLSELLISLVIIGVIATLTIPALINKAHNKTFASQVKNIVANIEQLAQDELIANHTRDLSDTDFGTPAKLLSDKHFYIIKTCTAKNSLKNCWKSKATGNDKITYKRLNGVTNNPPSSAGITIILKNGVMISYTQPANGSTHNKTGDIVGLFVIDINGNEKPNIGGRDYFAFLITNKGKIVDESYGNNANDSLSTKINKCKKTSAWYCYGALVDSGWKMDY